MIDELRATLDRHSDDVIARPDPYARVVRLRRRRQQRRVTAFAVVFVLLVTTPTIWLLAPMDGPHYAAPPVPAALLPLLNSPTRGSLAGDGAFLAVMRRRAANEVGPSRDNPAGGPYMPTDPDRIKVLFAGDIGMRRYVMAAGMDGWPLLATFLGNAAERPEDLSLSGSGALEAVAQTHIRGEEGPQAENTFLLLGPTGAIYERAQSQWTSTGVTRTWTEVPALDGYLAIVNVTAQQRLRVRLGDKVLREVTAYPSTYATTDVDPVPYGGRGTPFPDAAREVASSLANLTQLADTDVTMRVLWSEQVPAPGAADGLVQAVTVQVVSADGGGPYTTGFVDGAGDWRDQQTASGFAADPAHALIVLRLPSYVAEDNERLQIIAPPSAVRADLVQDGRATQIALTKGVGWRLVPPKATVTVRAYDAAGTLLATTEFTDLLPPQCDRLDPTTCQDPVPAAPVPVTAGPTP
ncbi:hypothetical protein Cme02nite_63460 [Catellatospora methionotrophica]|uniref:Uncharacterized protein n=1 Tax=Catellatospora methionotrophica TaxID=121620 RepID=A0A8J3LFU0_9ACTN|nr:hypothetical protein [Catellatospora methionotrophica]GIG18014.1 hypothetical protein Cme02nite_63460 [Catellatospora methionotrophica]